MKYGEKEMSTCNCFVCRCSKLLKHKKISEETYNSLILGYYLGKYITYNNVFNIFKKIGIKPTNLMDKDIGGMVAGVESSNEYAKYVLNTIAKEHKLFKNIIKKYKINYTRKK